MARMTRPPKILVAGDVMLDRYWIGSATRLSPEAPVPVLPVTLIEDRPGGAANVAKNLSMMGADVTLLGMVGDDEPGNRLRELLPDVYCRFLPCAQTTMKLRMVSDRRQMMRADFESKTASIDTLPGGYDLVVLSDYAKGAMGRITSLIAQCNHAYVPVLVDPKTKDWSRYYGATLIKPNISELPTTAPPRQLRSIYGMGAILVTEGANGMTLHDGDGEYHVPTEAREVFDVTGAGDTVMAGMAYGMATGLTMRDAMSLANRAAGIAVSKFGTAAVSV